MLGRDVSWGLVQHWIHGRTPLPQWAADRLGAKLQALAAPIAPAIAKESRAQQGARHWRAYHARRARERDEQARKEKGEL